MRISAGNFHYWEKKNNLSCGATHPRILKRLNQGKPAVNQGCNSAGTHRETVKNKPKQ